MHAIPNHGHYGTTAYYHNKTLIEESGAALPNPDWTVDDYVAIGKAVTAPPEVWGVRSFGTGQEHVPSYLRIFGGDAISEDGMTSLLAQEESIAGLRWLHDLQHRMSRRSVRTELLKRTSWDLGSSTQTVIALNNMNAATSTSIGTQS